MDCRAVREYLPWLLNGTLEAGERAAVVGHLRGCTACREALDLTREAAEAAATHLPIEVILDLADDRPIGTDLRALADAHLAVCADCARELGAARLDPAAERPPRREGWAARGVPAWRSWRGLALAASLTAVVAAVGWWRAASQTDGASWTAPVAGVIAVELVPASPLRGGPPSGPTVTLRPDDRFVVVTLLPELVVDGGRNLVVLDADGGERFAVRSLEPDASGAMSVLLPAAVLDAGTYRLVLSPDDPPPDASSPADDETFELTIAQR